VQIAQVLRSKGATVATISRHATIREALSVLAYRSIGALVVSEDGDAIEGIVSERDIVRAMNFVDGPVLEMTVESIMSTGVRACHLDDDVDTLMALMTDLRVRHLPVVVDGHLVGIVSIGDVVKARIDELERDRQELVEYINAR